MYTWVEFQGTISTENHVTPGPVIVCVFGLMDLSESEIIIYWEHSETAFNFPALESKSYVSHEKLSFT